MRKQKEFSSRNPDPAGHSATSRQATLGERIAEKLAGKQPRLQRWWWSPQLRRELAAAIDQEIEPLIEASFNDTAQNLAQMVTEWVEDGVRSGTDWRNGLADLIALRLKRIQMSKPALAQTSSVRDAHAASTFSGEK